MAPWNNAPAFHLAVLGQTLCSQVTTGQWVCLWKHKSTQPVSWCPPERPASPGHQQGLAAGIVLLQMESDSLVDTGTCPNVSHVLAPVVGPTKAGGWESRNPALALIYPHGEKHSCWCYQWKWSFKKLFSNIFFWDILNKSKARNLQPIHNSSGSTEMYFQFFRLFLWWC